jgi:nucleoid DNA-binding protein
MNKDNIDKDNIYHAFAKNYLYANQNIKYSQKDIYHICQEFIDFIKHNITIAVKEQVKKPANLEKKNISVVKLHNFCALNILYKTEKKLNAINGKSNEIINIPAHWSIKVKISQNFKNLIKELTILPTKKNN